MALGGEAALLLQLPGEHVGGELSRVRLRACQGALHCQLDGAPRLARELRPFVCRHDARDEERLEPAQRVVGTLLAQNLGSLVGLGILPGVTREARHGEPQQDRCAGLALSLIHISEPTRPY